MGVNTFETLRLAHSSTVDRVVEELRRALFDGEVEAGTPLREMALAEAMGVSRSTVREALAILVGEGLATREPNRGVHVTELDPVAVHDVCTARGSARGGRDPALAAGLGGRPRGLPHGRCASSRPWRRARPARRS